MNKLNLILALLLVLIFALILPGLFGDRKPEAVPEGIRIELEQANTPEAQLKGLSGHVPLVGVKGMLFEFEFPQAVCMWNKDVDFPVSVGFFDEKWRLLNAEEMAAHSEKKTCSKVAAKYAIEMRAGWFDLKRKEIVK